MIKKLKNKTTYFIQMLKILWEIDRGFLISILGNIIFVSIQPFPIMILTRESINILTDSSRSYNELVLTVGILLSINLVIDLVINYMDYIINTKGNLIGNKLNERIFEKCIDMDYELLSRKDIQEKRQMAFKTIEGGRFNNLTSNFRILISNILIVFGVVFVISSIDWIIIIVTVLVIAANTISIYKQKKIEYSTTTDVIPVNRKINYYDTLSSDFSYMKEIKLFHMGKALISRQADLRNEILSFLKKIFKGYAKNGFINIITNVMLEIIIYLLLGYKLIVQKLIEVGDFTLYLTAIRQLKNALNSICSAFVDIDNNGQYISDFFEFLNITNKFDNGKIQIKDIVKDNFVIEFKNVSFTYPFTELKALKNINCRICQGDQISIVGENGSGKTTFIKLILRLYDPTEGVIELNGNNIKDINYTEYLNFFSAVFQDFKLFAFTFKDNITALQSVEDNNVMKVIERIGLDHKVMSLNKGLNTFLYKVYDENGIELSGGEGQRLAIARSLTKKSKIIILDEPTAALDPKVEADIFKNFDKITQNTTSISISHRMASSKNSSKVIVFQNGRIIEEGSHIQLIDTNGIYAELYNLQADMYRNEN